MNELEEMLEKLQDDRIVKQLITILNKEEKEYLDYFENQELLIRVYF